MKIEVVLQEIKNKKNKQTKKTKKQINKKNLFIYFFKTHPK